MANYITTTLKQIRRTIYEPTFYKVIQGGASAGKTFAIIELLISYAQCCPDTITTIVGLSYKHLEKGALRDFNAIMRNAGIYDPECWRAKDLVYTFPNGAIIEFASIDNMSARGPRRDVLFVNEANGLLWDTFDQLSTRTRDFAIIDYNPSAEFWAHTQLIERNAHDTSFLIVTYKDNEALSDRERQNIENHAPRKGEKPSNWWRVYGMGLVGSLEGNIYHGWKPATDDEFFDHAKLIRYGLDFGFSNDETALVAVYEDADGTIGLRELIYEPGILGSQYPSRLERAGVDPSVLIVADGARPEIIAEIAQAGYMITPADKGPGSVKEGLDHVMEKQIVYDGKNIEKEYLSYAWRTTRTGKTIDVPQDGNDHTMDATRYAINDLYRPRFDF